MAGETVSPWGAALPEMVKDYLAVLRDNPLDSGEAQKIRIKWVTGGARLDPEAKAAVAREYMKIVLGLSPEQIEGFIAGSSGSLGLVGGVVSPNDEGRGTIFWEEIGKSHPSLFDKFDLEGLTTQDPHGVGAWTMLNDWHLSLPNTPLISEMMITDAAAYK